MIYDDNPASGKPRGGKISNKRVPKPRVQRPKQAQRNTKTAPGINLRAVAEVLTSYGMDPAVEFCKVLQIEGALDPEVRARMMLEIMQYVHPKLKAVELSQDKPFEAVIRWATD